MNKEVCLDGSNNAHNVVNSFAAHFSKVYHGTEDSAEVTSEFFNSHAKLKDASKSKPDFDSLVAIETVDRCAKQLKIGKACGPDELSSEHIKHAHPSLLLH